jgi:hypothetical protein
MLNLQKQKLLLNLATINIVSVFCFWFCFLGFLWDSLTVEDIVAKVRSSFELSLSLSLEAARVSVLDFDI